MLLHSLRSIRKHSDIDIVVYTDPIDLLLEDEHLREIAGIQLMEFDSSKFKVEGDPWLWEWSEVVLHKWPNCVDLLLNHRYDRVFFSDPDVHFYQDPNRIFDAYTDPSKVYIKREDWGAVKGFNDGTFILSREVAEKLVDYMTLYPPIREKMIADYRESKKFDPAKLKQFRWVTYQHATRYMFDELGIEVEWLDKRYVRKMDDEPGENWVDEFVTDDLVAVHYYRHHARRFVPYFKYRQKL